MEKGEKEAAVERRGDNVEWRGKRSDGSEEEEEGRREEFRES